MSHNIDQVGVYQAMDLLEQATSRVKKLIQLYRQVNTEIARGRIGAVQDEFDRAQNAILQEIQNYLGKYVDLLLHYGMEHHSASNREYHADALQVGFTILNETSGLKLALLVNNLRFELERITEFSETQQELLGNRLQFLSMILKTMRQETEDISYKTRIPANSGNSVSYVFNGSA